MWRFAVDTGRYFPASLLPAFFSVAAAALFTRIFSPFSYGIYSLALAIVVPLTTVLSEWAAQPIGRFYAEYEHQGSGMQYRQLIAMLALIIGVIVIVLVTLCAMGLLLIYGFVPHLLVFSGAAAVLLIQSLTAIVIPVLPASLRPTQHRRAVVLSAGMSVTLAVALVYSAGADVGWLLWGQALATTLMFPYVCRNAGVSFTPAVLNLSSQSIEMLQRFWRYGAPMMLWFVASGILSLEDRYVIQVFRDSTEVGIYSANYGLVSGLSILLRAPVLMAAGPILYHQWAQGAIKDAKHTIARMTELYFILSFALLGGFISAGEVLARLILGSAFWPGTTVLIPVLIGQIIWGAASIGHKSLELHERTMRMAWSALFAALSNLAFNLILVPRFGYIAAAYTTLGSYVVYAALIWWQSRSFMPWSVDLRAVATYLGAMFVAAVAARSALMFLPETSTVVRFGIAGTLFVLIYGVMVSGLAHKRVSLLLRAGSSL